ncbi:MAG: hypothetical protein E6447_15655, partial [Bradyrhizobium sp.]|nr:hypothetical protein [Bradyrhizobium sp.]
SAPAGRRCGREPRPPPHASDVRVDHARAAGPRTPAPSCRITRAATMLMREARHARRDRRRDPLLHHEPNSGMA